MNFPKRYDDYATSIALIYNDGESSCYQETIEVYDSAKWKITMKEEMDVLKRIETWNLVELPKDMKVASCKWV